MHTALLLLFQAGAPPVDVKGPLTAFLVAIGVIALAGAGVWTLMRRMGWLARRDDPPPGPDGPS